MKGVVVLLLGGLMLCGCWRRESPPYRFPLSQAHIVGVWSGFDESDGYYYRLILRTNRTGTLGRLYQTNAINVAAVVSWSLNDYDVSLTVERDRDGEIVSGKGVVEGHKIKILFRSSSGWEHHVVLRREPFLQRNQEMLSRAMRD